MRALETFAQVLGSVLAFAACYFLFMRRGAAQGKPAQTAPPATGDPLSVGRLRGGLLAFICALLVDIFCVVLLFAPAPTAGFATAVLFVMFCLGIVAALVSAAGVVAVAPPLGHSRGATVALATLALVPAVNIVIILVMSAQVTAALRAAGEGSPFTFDGGLHTSREVDPSDTWD